MGFVFFAGAAVTVLNDRFVLSKSDVAALLGISVRTFERDGLAGQIPSVPVGSRRKYRPEAVREWLQKNEELDGKRIAGGRCGSRAERGGPGIASAALSVSMSSTERQTARALKRPPRWLSPASTSNDQGRASA